MGSVSSPERVRNVCEISALKYTTTLAKLCSILLVVDVIAVRRWDDGRQEEEEEEDGDKGL